MLRIVGASATRWQNVAGGARMHCLCAEGTEPARTRSMGKGKGCGTRIGADLFLFLSLARAASGDVYVNILHNQQGVGWDLSVQRCSPAGRNDVVLGRLFCDLAACGQLCRSHPQGRASSGPCHRTGDGSGAEDQSQDRESPRPQPPRRCSYRGRTR